MASFKAHIAFGILTAVCYTAVMLMVSWVSIAAMPLVFLSALFGSVLPDIDSDTGIPVRLLIGALALIAVTLSLIYSMNIEGVSILQHGFVAVGVGLFVYFVIGGIFKHFTAHRGIFHSIPAALLTGLVAMSIAGTFNVGEKTELAVGLAITMGYLAHLLLDEINSTVNLSGMPFKPKKSLGTALKLTSSSKTITVLTYCTLLLFVGVNAGSLARIFN